MVSAIPPANISAVEVALGCRLHETLVHVGWNSGMIIPPAMAKNDGKGVAIVTDGADGG